MNDFIALSQPKAFLQGMGSILMFSAPVPITHLSTVSLENGVGLYWQHVGNYLSHAIEALKPEVVSAENQLSLKL